MKANCILGGLAIAGIAITSCMPACADTTDQIAIKKILNDGCQSWIDGKSAQSVDLYVKDIVVFDVAPPRQKSHDQVVQFNQMLIANTVGRPTCVYEEIHPVILTEEYAYSYSILYTAGKMKDGHEFRFRERSTNVWKKISGQWRCLHEHNSIPVDVISGKPDMESNP
jgi:ketosteroid isomerase-like protein